VTPEPARRVIRSSWMLRVLLLRPSWLPSSPMPPRARWAVVASCVALALGGCGGDSFSLEVTFADSAARQATAALELTLRAGDCETGEILWQRVLRADEQPSDLPPSLARGRAYCVEAIARDAVCRVTASATSASADAPVGHVTLELVAPTDAPAGCEDATCVEGTCVERCDDEGVACVAGGVSGVCRAGACCTGCWDGETCRPGTPAAEIAAGELFSCLRSVDGRVACWGSNGQGELGDGTRGGSTGPSWRADARAIDVPDGVAFSTVTAGVATAYAIDTDGRLWAWGWNESGQLGLGAAVGVNALSPVIVAHPLGNAWERVAAVNNYVQAAAPLPHACAFSRGELWCWGANEQGQVDPSQPSASRDPIIASPSRVEGLFEDVALTQGATCVVREDGAGVACWGDNSHGELGTGDDAPRTGIVPVTLPEGALPVAEIAAGVAGFCVRSAVDRVFCWGDASGTNLPTAAGTVVRSVDEATALAPIAGSSEERRLALGRTHGGALTGEAPITWGSNVDGRLALGAGAPSGPLPPGATTAFPGPATIARGIATGSAHTCVRLDDGSLACAGSNRVGQLGVPVVQPEYPDWQRYCPCLDCAP